VQQFGVRKITKLYRRHGASLGILGVITCITSPVDVCNCTCDFCGLYTMQPEWTFVL